MSKSRTARYYLLQADREQFIILINRHGKNILYNYPWLFRIIILFLSFLSLARQFIHTFYKNNIVTAFLIVRKISSLILSILSHNCLHLSIWIHNNSEISFFPYQYCKSSGKLYIIILKEMKLKYAEYSRCEKSYIDMF